MLSLFALLVFALVLIVIGYTISILSGLGHWNRIYYRLSQRYGGKGKFGGVMYGYYFSTPTLFFNYGRTYCTLKSQRRWLFLGPKTTEVKMNWPRQSCYYLVVSCLPQRSFPNANLVPIEDESFSERFEIRSDRASLAKKMISPSVKWQLERLRGLKPENHLTVTLTGYKLVVTKPGFIKHYQTLEEFIRLSLELFDLMMLSEEEGVSFVTQTDVQLIENVKCPVCSGKIEGAMMICNRCKTPHCQECWEYNGRCATYACDGTGGELLS